MDKVMAQVEPVIKKVDDFIAKYPSMTQYEKFKELEDKTGYSKVYFFVASFSLAAMLIFVTGGMKLCSNLIGFLYPAYMSFKALDGGKSVDGDATQWMTYWIIFCSVNLIEDTFPFLPRSISFFYVVKVLAVIWLYHPKTTGAQVIYTSGLRPYILPLMEGSPTEPKKTE
mmetsp:Transcript_24583/g.57733  ORF Transcript_24583/g.57733 Transcript_24583/m.57733 type:complete len:170 (+) Transcript_24583:200-709(+)|eukprot:CAMPEP_0197196154 /NCGR_PEP_ID=MMETSP1423-20130617/32203_1 /TAXON_ID=476441 /ORGANISM="Pseudo-nitzschia heimii, Strain UNC1101" /LENGTH=169 /DNA_ID=CAMNT_0042649931 /DNA_START=577 /DNA_END=1086 /DNA_ORIENTATION=-